MPRPPLPLGTYGNITVHRVPSGGYCAVTRFRDHDGVTRKVKKVAATSAAAKSRLCEALRDRSLLSPTSGLAGDSRFRVAADEWIGVVDQLVGQGLRSPNTAQLYRLNLMTHVLPVSYTHLTLPTTPYV